MRMPQNTRICDLRFRPSGRLSHNNTICMCFPFDPLSREFSNRCVFDENAAHYSVVGRPKRIEMFAISNENALVWTGPKPIALLLFLVTGAVR